MWDFEKINMDEPRIVHYKLNIVLDKACQSLLEGIGFETGS